MKFTCKKCKTLYTIADEKVLGKVIKVHCKRCNQLMVIRDQSPVSLPLTAPNLGKNILQDTSIEGEFESAFSGLYQPAASASPQVRKRQNAPESLDSTLPVWFYGLDGSEEGPLSLPEMEEKIRSRQISEDHFVWRDGLSDWIPIEEAPELAGFFRLPPKLKTAPAAMRKEALEKEREESILKRKEAELRRRREESQRVRELQAQQIMEQEQRRKSEEEESRRRAEQERQLEVAKQQQQAVDEEDRRRLEARPPPPQKVSESLPAKPPAASETSAQEEGRKEEGRISEHFFASGEFISKGDELLPSAPPLPSKEIKELVKDLHQASVAEEQAGLGQDPIEVLRQRERPEKAKEMQIITAQAGVKPRARHISVALLSTILAVAVVIGGGVVGLGAALGWFSSDKAGVSGDLFGATGPKRASDLNPNLSEAEARRLKEKFEERLGKTGNSSTGSDTPRVPSGITPLSTEGKRLQAFYQSTSEERHEETPRLPRDPTTTMMTPDMPNTNVGTYNPTPIKKDLEQQPDSVSPSGGTAQLGEAQINAMFDAVLKAHLRQIRNCLDHQLKRDSSVVGKIELVVRIQPSGKVESVRNMTPKFAGTYVEECLGKYIMRWRFQAFSGPSVDAHKTFVLSGKDDYSP